MPRTKRSFRSKRYSRPDAIPQDPFLASATGRNNLMYIAEVFYSIQGEGELTGVPSVFIRTSGCNLRCAWCDTKYASWYPEGTQMSVEDVVSRVLEFGCRYCVLTGGEPMIAKDIHKLAERLRSAGKH